ncbi:Carrier domain-containing protein [Bordetella sputigena]|uniref:condensation domain-containing protein n=1 Tax=Bordetella sputigena TaxID=1416810 RepID=UPI0039EED8DD
MTSSATPDSGAAATIDARLRGHARARGDAIALIVEHGGGALSLTYAELDAAAAALAAVLRSRMPKGSRALLMLDNDQHYVVGFFACLYAGMIAVPAFPPDPAREQELRRLQVIVRDCQAACVLTTAQVALGLADALAWFDGVPLLAVDQVALAPGDASQPPAADPQDIAFLQYTSGSTADPKGVMVSHANLMANALAMHEGMGTRESDVCVSWLPLYHDMGLIGGLLEGLYLGTRVVLMSPRYFLERPIRWLEAISRHRGNFSGGPDFAYRLCLERIRPEQLRDLDLSSWRIAFSGAEPVNPDTLAAFARLCAEARLPAAALYPCYGLAEATLFVTGGDHTKPPICTVFDEAALAAGQARPAGQGRRLVACGVPAPGHRVAIVDPASSRLLPDGRQGEIWTAGPSIARGYWGNGEATRRSIVSRDGLSWLRTGDLGFMYGGELYVNGRIKDLIIVRGRNVYPQDIEAVVEAEVPQARKGRVAAFAVETPDGEGIGLAAEIAPLQRKRHAPGALVRALARAVALACGEPLSVAVLLEPGTLPKTSSGKLQRAATRAGWRAGSLHAYAIHEHGRFVLGEAGDAGAMPPREGTEAALAGIWAVALGRRAEDRKARFFEMGGSSLTAASVAAAIRGRWGIAVGVRDVFAHPELAECASHIDVLRAARVGHAGAAADADGAAAGQGALAPVQRRLWLLDRLAAEPAARARYNVGAVFHLDGELDAVRVESAINAIVARHAVLRTVYPEDDDGEPRASILADARIDVPVVDLTTDRVAAPDTDAAAGRIALEYAEAPFDLSTGPLLRARLLRLGEHRHLLLMAVHHIVFDGWSAGVFVDEFCAHYAGREPPALRVQYGDYAAAAARAEANGAWRESLAYWKTTLTHAPVRSSPRAGPSGGASTTGPGQPAAAHAHERPPGVAAADSATGTPAALHAGRAMPAATLRQTLPGSLARRLADLARRHDATLFQVLMTVFLMTVHRHTAQDDIVVGTDAAGRDDPSLSPLIGFFVNVLPIRSRALRAAPFQEWLARTRATVLDALDHQQVPFDRIVDTLGMPRDRDGSPLVQMLFVMQNTLRLAVDLPDVVARPAALPTTHARFELAVFVHEHAQGLEIEWTYAAALFAPDVVEKMATIWADVLHQVAADDGRPWSIADIPPLPEPTMSATTSRAATPAESAVFTGAATGVAPADAAAVQASAVASTAAQPAPASSTMRGKLDRLSARRTGAGGDRAAPASMRTAPVRMAPLSAGRPFPLVIEAVDPDLDPIAWAASQRARLEALLNRHGGILFRGFALRTPQQFESFAEAIEPTLYGGYGDLPKKEGGRNTYRSTPYPEKQMILYHNESAHLERWPRRQLFFCELPSRVGGATPIVDCREMLQRLPAEIVQEFARRELLYVRTFTERLDVSWQRFFGTDDRQAVETTLRRAGTDFRWLDDSTLQTRTRCPAVITHPDTGERVFFNQAQLHHIHCLEPDVRADLLSIAGVERMPRHVYFGDGGAIPEWMMEAIGRTYEDCAVRFDWAQGDVVMLDNMLAAHARDPYEEPRKVVVAMGAMFDRSALTRG